MNAQNGNFRLLLDCWDQQTRAHFVTGHFVLSCKNSPFVKTEIMPPICKIGGRMCINHWLRVDCKTNAISPPEIHNVVRELKL